MDATKDKPRPGSRSDELNKVDELAVEGRSATGENVGPERSAGVEPGAPAGDGNRGGASTSELEPELRGKPERGSRLDGEG